MQDVLRKKTRKKQEDKRRKPCLTYGDSRWPLMVVCSVTSGDWLFDWLLDIGYSSLMFHGSCLVVIGPSIGSLFGRCFAVCAWRDVMLE